jgi:glutamate dehydrogenase
VTTPTVPRADGGPDPDPGPGGLDDATASPEHLALAHRRAAGQVLLSVLPGAAAGARVLIVADDVPLLIESLLSELRRRGIGTDRVVHPRVLARRTADGSLTGYRLPGADAAGPDTRPEAWIDLHLRAPLGAADAEELAGALRGVLARVHEIAAAAPALTARLTGLVDRLAAQRDDPDAEEAAAFLRWSVDGNLVPLAMEPAGDQDPEGPVLSFARDPEPVHTPRTVYPLRLTVRLPDGDRYALRAIFTLYGRSCDPLGIPVLGTRLLTLLRAAGLDAGSWSGQRALELLQRCPRTELLGADDEVLLRIVTSVPEVVDDRQVRVVSHGEPGGPVSVLVFVPQDRATPVGRAAARAAVAAVVGGRCVELAPRTTESRVTILHLVVEPAGEPPAAAALERAVETTLVAAMRSWSESLLALAGPTARRARFAPEYQADHRPALAAADLARLDALAVGRGIDVALREPDERARTDAGTVRLALYCAGHRVSLSTALPQLHALGLVVLDEHPYEVTRGDGTGCWINDFTVRLPAAVNDQQAGFEDRLVGSMVAAWDGRCEADGLTSLILTAGLTWRQVEVLRALTRYQHQLRSSYSSGYVVETLQAHPRIAAALVALFEARFDPDLPHVQRAPRAARLDIVTTRLVDDLVALDADQILRGLLELVRAVVRTNHFQRDGDGRPRPVLALKFDPARVAGMPEPRPEHEAFVYSARVEGVHLRFGDVARGGLRWSDRIDDYRTEVLGLARTQTVKNAVIVPAGAKGGFVVKRPADSPQDLRAEAGACYRLFVSAALDLVDDRGPDSRVRPPERTVRHDGDDTFLVVAADKGTAALSDVANEIAVGRGFWLGDAFASGGSTGYDHRLMGITARGAWCSARRHFRELGVRVGTDPISVVGIGDMSGDVFGNGMLLVRGLRLVAAFDHRHVFLDPDPDPDAAHAERARLHERPGSSWADYDPALISAGGGVWPRTAKSIPVSARARRALGLSESVARLDPNGLVRAILRAPVDLLWNGGIGTYVKAAAETHQSVGDRANDGVRVDGDLLRAAVVVEGGNLGLTQAGRVEYARAGGRLTNDAVDNSAGVGCSDHEVTMKILTDLGVRRGLLTGEQRNALLAELTDEVAELVLADNVAQNDVLGLARSDAAADLEVHARLIAELEERGRVDRRVEGLPDAEELAARRAAGAGLTSPELAVLLAHVKLALVDDIATDAVLDDPVVAGRLSAYFPPGLVARLADVLDAHPLRRQIITTVVANEVVNAGGIGFVHRLAAATGASSGEIVRAYCVAVAVFGLDELRADIAHDAARLPVGTGDDLVRGVRELLDRACRWLLVNRPQPLAVAAETARFRAPVEGLRAGLPELLSGSEAAAFTDRAERLAAAGVGAATARRWAALPHEAMLLDVVQIGAVQNDVAAGPASDPGLVAATYFAMADRLGMYDLLSDVAELDGTSPADVLAGEAIRHEIGATLRGLTTDVLLVDRPPTDRPPRVDALVGEWERPRRAALERAMVVRSDLREQGGTGLAAVTAILHQIRRLLRTPGPVPV